MFRLSEFGVEVKALGWGSDVQSLGFCVFVLRGIGYDIKQAVL